MWPNVKREREKKQIIKLSIHYDCNFEHVRL